LIATGLAIYRIEIREVPKALSDFQRRLRKVPEVVQISGGGFGRSWR
jgi:hypothetical protein